jgi:hypothetical protein
VTSLTALPSDFPVAAFFAVLDSRNGLGSVANADLLYMRWQAVGYALGRLATCPPAPAQSVADPVAFALEHGQQPIAGDWAEVPIPWRLVALSVLRDFLAAHS